MLCRTIIVKVENLLLNIIHFSIFFMVSTRSREGRPLPAPRASRRRGQPVYRNGEGNGHRARNNNEGYTEKVVAYTRRKPRR